MALQSQLFRGDAKLEAAAVSDPAHIGPGASGAHVGKIQQALVRLDQAKISIDSAYGPATAGAVLAYKRKRDIVNRSYQTSADNIVGKMTIAAMDAELLASDVPVPVVLVPVHPIAPRPETTRAIRPSGGLVGFPSSSIGSSVAAPAVGQAAKQIEVIKTVESNGRLLATPGDGKKIRRIQSTIFFNGEGKNFEFQVAKLVGAKAQDIKLEERDMSGPSFIVAYETMNCGETFFQASNVAGGGESDIIRLLSLKDKAEAAAPRAGSNFAPDPAFSSGLVSMEGTPLNPLPGTSINLFGEGETPGFDDYASHIDFCTHRFNLGNNPGTIRHRPWTADPRKPPGIPDKSVQNICCRSSPLNKISFDEIFRIAASGCRFTYAEADGHFMSDRVRAALTSRGAQIVKDQDKDRSKEGHAIVLVLP